MAFGKVSNRYLRLFFLIQGKGQIRNLQRHLPLIYMVCKHSSDLKSLQSFKGNSWYFEEFCRYVCFPDTLQGVMDDAEFTFGLAILIYYFLCFSHQTCAVRNPIIDIYRHKQDWGEGSYIAHVNLSLYNTSDASPGKTFGLALPQDEFTSQVSAAKFARNDLQEFHY